MKHPTSEFGQSSYYYTATENGFSEHVALISVSQEIECLIT